MFMRYKYAFVGSPLRKRGIKIIKRSGMFKIFLYICFIIKTL